MNTTILKTTAAPTWGASACTRDRFGIAPFSSVQGSGLPFAGYGAQATVLSTGKSAAAMTLAAVRHDDARVPDPRGRQR